VFGADDAQLDLVSYLPAKQSAASEPEEPTPPTEDEDAEEEDPVDEDDVTPPPSSTSPRSTGNDDPRQVSTAEAEAYAKECHLLFFEASAKVGPACLHAQYNRSRVSADRASIDGRECWRGIYGDRQSYSAGDDCAEAGCGGCGWTTGARNAGAE